MQNAKKPGRPPITKDELNAAKRLKEARIKSGLTLGQVEQKTGIPIVRYKLYEIQFSNSAQVAHLASLSAALNADPAWIRHGDSAPEKGIGIQLDPPGLNTVKLARRAKKRRIEVGARLNDVAEMLQMSGKEFASAESRLPINLPADKAVKWEDALRAPRGWLTDESIEIEPTAKEILGELQERTAAEEIQAIGRWLSRKTSRTQDPSRLTKAQSAWADIFARRYGVFGQSNSTLAAIGDAYGMTRERARQIVAKMLERAQGEVFGTPIMDRIGKRVLELTPAKVEEIDELLREELGEHLSIRGIEAICRDLKNTSLVSITRPRPIEESRSAHSHDDTALIRHVRNCAMKMVRGCGAAQIHFVAGAASAESGLSITVETATRCCKLHNGFSWIAKEDGWFWFGEVNENRLLTVARKVLVAAQGRVDVSEIHQAMTASQKFPGAMKQYPIDAPIHIILKTLSQTSWLQVVQSNDFVMTERVDPSTVLNNLENALVKFIEANGGICSKFDIDKHIGQTMDVSDIYVATALSKSPIVTRIGRGMYAIRGKDITPGGMKAALDSVGGVIKSGFDIDPDGFMTWEFSFTEYSQRNRLLHTPAALARRMAEGTYQLLNTDQRIAFKLRPEGKGSYFSGLSKKLIDRGATPGARVEIKVNPSSKIVQISIRNQSE